MYFFFFFFSSLPLSPLFTLFPYTTLFRSRYFKLTIHYLTHFGMVCARVCVERGGVARGWRATNRSEEHKSELQSPDHLVCRLLLEKKKSISISSTNSH